MTPSLRTHRPVLEPLRVEHADEMAPLLDDPALHTFTGGTPATADELRDRYARQVAGHPDGRERRLNWIVRHGTAAVGYVQPTVVGEQAEPAWVIGTAHQGRGYAREAATAVAGWLGERVVVAHIHPENAASTRVAEAVGLQPTDTVVDGELGWASDLQHGGFTAVPLQ